MGDIKFCKRFKISFVVFLILFAIILTTSFFVFDDKSQAQFYGQKNILLSYNYQFPKVAVGTKEITSAMVPIFMYHYVRPAPQNCDLPTLYTEPEILENHLKSVKEMGYNTIFPKELGYHFKFNKNIADNPVIFSFDDGYEDFYTNAFPIFKKYNAKAVLYVIYEFMDKPGYITKEQAKEMIDSGLIEIGSHTLTHVKLAEQTEQESFRQLYESRIKLSQALDEDMVSFAFPFGIFSLKDEILSERAGYLNSVSTYPGVWQKKSKMQSFYRLRPNKKINQDFKDWLNKEIYK